MKSGDRLTFLPILNKELGLMLQMSHEGGWSYVYSLLQSSSESMDLEGLFSLLGWFRFLEA